MEVMGVRRHGDVAEGNLWSAYVLNIHPFLGNYLCVGCR